MPLSVKNEKEALLRMISALGLAVYDTILYLDIHDCDDAREYLRQKKHEYAEAVSLYEEKYGIINLSGHPCNDIEWPWQIESHNGRC